MVPPAHENKSDIGYGQMCPSLGDTLMNRNQVKGATKDVVGKVQRKIGEATGNANQQVKGTGKQIEGKIQKGLGDTEKAADNANKGKV